jgi:ribosomal protein S2
MQLTSPTVATRRAPSTAASATSERSFETAASTQALSMAQVRMEQQLAISKKKRNHMERELSQLRKMLAGIDDE